MKTLDKIFIVNLPRRTDRRIEMESRLDALELAPELREKFEFFPAVDGSQIDEAFMKQGNYGVWEGWQASELPVHFYHRDVRNGEIGCALSHVNIWKKVVEEDLDEVLILEDDAGFDRHFKFLFERALKFCRHAKTEGKWDLLYLGRNAMTPDPFQILNFLSMPGFSYCTHGYMVTRSGAEKLLSVGFEQNLIPVDEFLPAMFHQHIRGDVLERFALEDPIWAYAVTPNVVHQVDYTDSDTECSSDTMKGGEPSAAKAAS